MNNVATSKEALLDISIRLASEKGFSSLNIRDIAKNGGVSVGCVYNYFPSKASLVAATVEKIWESIFHHANLSGQPAGFLGCVRWIFDSIQSGSERYPTFFTLHAMSFTAREIGDGRAVMNQFFEHMKRGLLQALQDDPEVRKDVFHEGFSESDYVSFIFDNLIMLSMKQVSSCEFLLKLIQRSIY